MYHSSPADIVLYGGAAGGGKSRAAVMEALQLCLDYPKTVAYLFRKTYPELRDTLIAEARANVPDTIGKYNESKHTYTLVNGSEMRFRHCNSEKDMYIYQGAEIHWLFLDELTHFSKKVYDFLCTRLRAKVELGIKPKVRCSTNPGGVGHGWVKAMFIEGKEPFKIHKKRVYSTTLKKTQTKTIQYIPAYATDNPHITEDYIFELENKPEALRKALLNGDWNVFEGQVFMEWRNEAQHYTDQRYTHVIKQFKIPKEWTRYMSFDFGYAKPFSVGWWALDPDGRAYRYDELYGCTNDPNTGVKWHPKKIAQAIREHEEAYEHDKGKGIIRIADPSIWDRSRGESVAEQMESEGIIFEPGDNKRIAGKMQIHYRLAFDDEGKPMMYIFTTCKHFIRTFPDLVYSQTNVEDVDTACEDHQYDETKYFCMAYPIGPRKHHVPEEPKFDPLSTDTGQPVTNYGFMRL